MADYRVGNMFVVGEGAVNAASVSGESNQIGVSGERLRSEFGTRGDG